MVHYKECATRQAWSEARRLAAGDRRRPGGGRTSPLLNRHRPYDVVKNPAHILTHTLARSTLNKIKA